MIRLGQKVKDIVSGLEGIATARCEFLNGCVRYIIQPPLGKENKWEEERWFDEGQLEFVGDGVCIEPKRTGGPSSSRPDASPQIPK